MEILSVEKVGGKIHAILNNTLLRPLTIREYRRLIKLIALLAEDAWKYQDLQN